MAWGFPLVANDWCDQSALCPAKATLIESVRQITKKGRTYTTKTGVSSCGTDAPLKDTMVSCALPLRLASTEVLHARGPVYTPDLRSLFSLF